MQDESMNGSEETPNTTLPQVKKPYRKPVLNKLGSLREMTLKKNWKGAADGKRNRFTGRGGHRVAHADCLDD